VVLCVRVAFVRVWCCAWVYEERGRVKKEGVRRERERLHKYCNIINLINNNRVVVGDNIII
jgi:hypothetical protein